MSAYISKLLSRLLFQFPDGYHCVGHGADDPVLATELPLTDAVLAAADGDGDGEISNWEFYLAIDPNDVNGLDYVYDNFDWDHCIGVDPDEL